MVSLLVNIISVLIMNHCITLICNSRFNVLQTETFSLHWFVLWGDNPITKPKVLNTSSRCTYSFWASVEQYGRIPLPKQASHISVLTSSWQYIKSLWKAPCRGFNTKSGLRTHICRENSNLIKRKCVIAKHIPLLEWLPNIRGTVLSPSVATGSEHPQNTLSGALREQTG